MTPSPHESRRVDIGEMLLALGAIVFGILIIWQTTLIRLTPAYSKVGPRVIPYIVGAGLVIVGAWLAYEALTGRAATGSAESEDADPTLPTDWRCIGLLALALLAYLLLIERAGFIIASATLFVMAAFAMGSRRLRARHRDRCHPGDSPLSRLQPRPRLVATGRGSGGDRLGGRDGEAREPSGLGPAGDACVAPYSHLARPAVLPTSDFPTSRLR